MQLIQWFPGHMTKAMRMIEENLKLVDAVIMILDARAPFACINEKLSSLIGNKPVLFVMNKSDLIESKDLKRISSEFIGKGRQIVGIVGTDKRSVNTLYDRIFLLLSEKIEKNKAKGVFKPMRVMVAGIPNTGKSTIINSICGSKKAVTGDKAGVTKGKQWIRLNEIELLDTPGTMPPSFENQTYAKHLAYIGSINDDILDFADLTLELLKELWEKYPELLRQKYGVEEVDSPISAFDQICKRRGFLLRGGEFDYDRCAKAVIDDFRKGRIGKICLE